jgi:periplasmic protein TonB
MFDKPRALVTQLDQRINQKLDAVAAVPPPAAFLSMQRATGIAIPMQSSSLISFGLHLFILLFVGAKLIDPNQFAPPHNVMDVVLVNAKTTSKPVKADALAQANLDGGGNTDEARRAKSPMPAIEQTAQSEARAAQQRIRELEQEMKTLMTQAKSSAKVLQGEVVSQPAGSPSPQTATELIQKTEAIERLEAAIAREYQAYQQRPRRTFIGARTAEYRFAHYVDQWRIKIERVGNLNYPEEAKARKIYGKLQLTIAIKANGEIEDVQINRSSGHRVLDEAAKRIVHLAAPYERFPDNIKRDTDILHITRTWMFTRDDVLHSE